MKWLPTRPRRVVVRPTRPSCRVALLRIFLLNSWLEMSQAPHIQPTIISTKTACALPQGLTSLRRPARRSLLHPTRRPVTLLAVTLGRQRRVPTLITWPTSTVTSTTMASIRSRARFLLTLHSRRLHPLLPQEGQISEISESLV